MAALNKEKELSVIVADDSSTVRLFIINALRQSNYPLKLTEADNGEACLQKLSSGSYDLAFIDINMPRMSGIEALNHSREMGVSTFITIMSTKQEPETLDVVRKLDAYAFLVKPFTIEDVLSIVRNYFQLTRPRSVLLVDDSRAIRTVIRRVLEHSQFNLETEEAKDGRDALSAYGKNRHDIVFLDLNMPGLTGGEALKQLRQMNPQVQVVLITTTQNRTQVEKLAPDSYASVLYKPFYTIDVDRTLHKLFGLKMPDLRNAEKPPSGKAGDVEFI